LSWGSGSIVRMNGKTDNGINGNNEGKMLNEFYIQLGKTCIYDNQKDEDKTIENYCLMEDIIEKFSEKYNNPEIVRQMKVSRNTFLKYSKLELGVCK
jgi:hypothetical protein